MSEMGSLWNIREGQELRQAGKHMPDFFVVYYPLAIPMNSGRECKKKSEKEEE